MNLSMIASSWSMSIAMLALASSSCTLISASRRSRDSGVRRSCEMPASITARSCSTLASSRAIRLKPMLTWRISLVIVVSSRRESYSPSRIRLAGDERAFGVGGVGRRDALDGRDPVDAVGAEERRAGDVDEARDLLRRLDRARLELERAK